MTAADQEMENCLAASLLLNSPQVEHIVRQSAPPTMFIFPAPLITVRSAFELIAKKAPVNFVSVLDRITRDGLLDECGGREGLASLAASTVVWEDAQFYADRVRDAYMLRRAAAAGERLKAAANDPRADWENVNKLKDLLFLELTLPSPEKDVIDFYEGTHLWINDLERRAERWEKQAISFGVQSIDFSVGKIFPGELCTIGAGTSDGKTMLAMQMAVANAMASIATLAFSLEMMNPQLWDRLFSYMARIHMSAFREKMLPAIAQEAIGAAFNRHGKMPLFVNNRRGLTLPGIISTIRRLKAAKQIGLVIVDYLQLVKASETRGKTRYLDVAEVVQELKEIAIELDLVVISPVQLNKEGNARESADIENSSDFFFKIEPGPEPNKRDAWLWVEKARQGRRHYKIPIELEFEYMTVKSRIATETAENRKPKQRVLYKD